MKRHSVICDPCSVVVVLFPFTEALKSKRRPALVLSARSFNENGHTVLAMITTKTRPSWPGDTPIQDHQSAGLAMPCIVRLKIFTLDNRLIVKQIGALSDNDRETAAKSLRLYINA